MNEHIMIVVILKTLAHDGDVEGYEASREKLSDWANARSLVVQPLISRDTDEARFANLIVDGEKCVDALVRTLSDQPFVDAAYIKPEDELP